MFLFIYNLFCLYYFTLTNEIISYSSNDIYFMSISLSCVANGTDRLYQ